MTFPSVEYKKLCIENAEKLREEWEPKFGDWVYCAEYGMGIIIENKPWEGKVFVSFRDAQCLRDAYCAPESLIPLPTPRQLWGLLEERGCTWNLIHSFRDEPCVAYVWTEADEEIDMDGPDPETALLRCLMEVMKERGTDK